MLSTTDIIELSNRIGIEQIPNELTEVKNKVFRLVEERGVAAFPYRKYVDNIFNYVKGQCSTINDADGEREIEIPNELSSKIDFIDNLTIKVKIINSTKETSLYKTGSGITEFKMNERLVNNKIPSVYIELTCHCYWGYILERTVYNSLYHELNHCYDAYMDLKTNGYYKRWNNQLKKSNIKVTDIFDDEKDNNMFETIFYRLFSETEFNALISSVYGDLEGMHSLRTNFQNDIKKTQAYYIWYIISTYYKPLFKKINETNFQKIKDLLKEHHIKLNPYGNSIDAFIKELIRKTTFLLNDLIKRIGKTASLYYDNREEKFPSKIIRHIDKNTDINYV